LARYRRHAKRNTRSAIQIQTYVERAIKWVATLRSIIIPPTHLSIDASLSKEFYGSRNKKEKG
jgi:phosphoenolpyruvate carboxylase